MPKNSPLELKFEFLKSCPLCNKSKRIFGLKVYDSYTKHEFNIDRCSHCCKSSEYLRHPDFMMNLILREIIGIPKLTMLEIIKMVLKWRVYEKPIRII